MKNTIWKTYFLWILLSVSVGALSGILSMGNMDSFENSALQPSFTPPKILFPFVWSNLYILMGISAAKVSLTEKDNTRSIGLNLFIIQLVVNFFWSLIFFNLQAYGLAFLWLVILWVLVLAMVYVFYKADPFTAYLQLPYLAWLSFAAYLSLGVWILNR